MPFAEQVVPALNNDKHVVDSNSEKQEGDHVVHWAVHEADAGAEPEGDHDTHGNADLRKAL